MSMDSTYNYKGPDNIVIENGIIKGIEAPSVVIHNSFGEMILELLRADPNFVGQVDGLTGREETFGEMTEKSVKCAMWLRKLNIKPGDVVGICCHNQMDMYVPCFASLYVGAVYNAWWDIGLTKELAKFFVTLTRPKVVFVNEATASIVLEAKEETGADIKIVVFGRQLNLESLDDIFESQDIKNVTDFRCTKLSSLEDPAIIIYTSGSTGMPKGVVYSNNSLFNNVIQYSKIGGRFKDTVTIVFSPLSWYTGIFSMLKGVVTPDRRIIYPEFTEETCFQLIEKHKINWLFLGPGTAFRLLKSPAILNYDVSSLKTMITGGAAVQKELQTALAIFFPGAFICQIYGSTELGIPGVEQTSKFRQGSCGKVTENIKMKIIDPETGRILNPNETGEACFQFRYMMKGYYKNPEATRETIDSQGWLHTGDLMFYDEEGHIFFVDRMKEMIKYRGNYVSPTMIEQLLRMHPAVREVAVVSVPHDIDDEHPIAFVAKNSEDDITEEEVQKMVADALPDYMKLRAGVKFVHELPHTPSDKVARMKLKNLAKSYAA